eukprot:3400655-Alexandrium_andersonii.AAC.1
MIGTPSPGFMTQAITRPSLKYRAKLWVFGATRAREDDLAARAATPALGRLMDRSHGLATSLA